MATSSITKNYVVRDQEAFKRLIKELNSLPPQRFKDTDSDALKEGIEAWKKFIEKVNKEGI